MIILDFQETLQSKKKKKKKKGCEIHMTIINIIPKNHIQKCTGLSFYSILSN